MRIEIGHRNYLAYLLLSHPAKIARLSSESRRRLDDINRAFNERIYSGDGAREYDRIHRYAEADQNEANQNDYPARALVDETWVGAGYGRALELGAGSGYFTTLIARHARSVVAVEPVPDIRLVLAERCQREGLEHVQVLGATALDLAAHVGEARSTRPSSSRACITSTVATRSSVRWDGPCGRAGGCSSSSRTTICGAWPA